MYKLITKTYKARLKIILKYHNVDYFLSTCPENNMKLKMKLKVFIVVIFSQKF